jgi:protein-S-isoprenylcysteine O-methyltransferase Ste14
MFKSIVKIMAATTLFAGIHSLLASRAAKRVATEMLSERRRNALYRPFYNAQAVITFGALVLYGSKLPDRELYRASEPLAGLMRFGQVVSLLYLIYGARQIGFLKFAGVPNLLAFLTGETSVPREPEGQGPILDANGEVKATGPFRTSRHPLNFGMIPALWLMPRMTVNLAAFNFVVTVYLIVGSVHEEERLRATYGQAYIDYQRSGINFFVPSASHLVIPKSNNSFNRTRNQQVCYPFS